MIFHNFLKKNLMIYQKQRNQFANYNCLINKMIFQLNKSQQTNISQIFKN